MTCTLTIDADFLKVPRAYKYVVYSPKMVEQDDCFEYLHSFAGRTHEYRDPNRCLKINPSYNTYGGTYMLYVYRNTCAHFIFTYAGEYHQYDFFVYPPIQKNEKGIWESGKAWVFSFFKRGSAKQNGNKNASSIPTTEEMVQPCLLFYLRPYKTLLLNDGEYPADFRVDQFVKHVRHIYLMHSELHVKHRSASSPTTVKVDQKSVSVIHVYTLHY